MQLFSDDFVDMDTDADFEEAFLKFPSYDRAYIVQAAYPKRRKIKEWMEGLWRQYAPFADKNFLQDFKIQFDQRSWELYFGATLLNRGFSLGAHDDAGPDFELIDSSGSRLAWVETVACSRGNGHDQVPEISYDAVSSVPEEQMMLRIANSIDSKYKKYTAELGKGWVKDTDPYVISINRSPLSHVDPGIPLIIKVLFGIGHLALHFFVGGVRQAKPESSWSLRKKVGKKSGQDVAMLFFEDKKYNCISAVIYTKDSILDSPQMQDEMGDNFIIIHNPLAKNPLPQGFFPFGTEYLATQGEIKLVRSAKPWKHMSL